MTFWKRFELFLEDISESTLKELCERQERLESLRQWNHQIWTNHIRNEFPVETGQVGAMIRTLDDVNRRIQQIISKKRRNIGR